jgi:HEPN domain-containing protein
MKDNKSDFAKQWLKKSKNDLIAASQSLKADEPPTDAVCFHAQQSIEKSLKALLTFNNIEFPKTHDLLFLLTLSEPILHSLGQYQENLSDMTS